MLSEGEIRWFKPEGEGNWGKIHRINKEDKGSCKEVHIKGVVPHINEAQNHSFVMFRKINANPGKI